MDDDDDDNVEMDENQESNIHFVSRSASVEMMSVNQIAYGAASAHFVINNVEGNLNNLIFAYLFYECVLSRRGFNKFCRRMLYARTLIATIRRAE